MLTIRFNRLGLRPGDKFLDAGAGFGRHAFEAARQGATVFALDYASDEVVMTRNTFGAMLEAKEITVGGHVRIYSATELKAKLRSAGLEVTASHHAHALHSPYWWLKCAVGPRNNDHSLVKKYREFLEWDIMTQPRSMQVAERALSPLMGKSFVVYSRKPLTVGASV